MKHLVIHREVALADGLWNFTTKVGTYDGGVSTNERIYTRWQIDDEALDLHLDLWSRDELEERRRTSA